MPSYRPDFFHLPESVRSVVEEVVSRAQPSSMTLFGSRARKTHRTNSDFDFSVKARRCSDEEWTALFVDLDEKPLSLFKIDLVEFERLNPTYQHNIKSEGILIYG
jgi:predicted nucleotidyltransferase